jgi:Flp pilus assembly protein TadB
MTAGIAAAFAAAAALLVVPARTRWPKAEGTAVIETTEDPGWMRRWRWLWAALAGVAGATFVGGRYALPAGVVTAALTWTWIGRSEPASVRRRREAAERELPGVAHLFATALQSGSDVAEALRLVCMALPGPASDLLARVPARLSLGMSPDQAWEVVLAEPALAPLGRAMVRAHRSGSPVTHEVTRLADELDRQSRLKVEERARAVGVKAAVPLGLCLLPSFVLIGVVPLVAALLGSLGL